MWMGASKAIASLALVVAASACADLDIVDHDALLLEPEGNIHTAMERCGPLPEDVELIRGLRTAWAVTAIPTKDNQTNFNVPTASMVLRLSDDEVSCDDELAAEPLTCPRAWATDIVLRGSDPVVGEFVLNDYGQGFNLSHVWREEGECVDEQLEGGFAKGDLEIISVTDECVIGRLIDTADTFAASGSAVQGGFVALRCGDD